MGRTAAVAGPSFAPMALYFAAIGAGYMLVEIVVLLRLQLYLGKPVYALSVALFAFLVSSGIGSWLTRRWDDRTAPRVIAAIVPAIAVVAVLFAIAWRLISSSTRSVGPSCARPSGTASTPRSPAAWSPP